MIVKINNRFSSISMIIERKMPMKDFSEQKDDLISRPLGSSLPRRIRLGEESSTPF